MMGLFSWSGSQILLYGLNCPLGACIVSELLLFSSETPQSLGNCLSVTKSLTLEGELDKGGFSSDAYMRILLHLHRK